MGLSSHRGPENRFECCAQRGIDLPPSGQNTKIVKACNTQMRGRNPARHDSPKMRKIRRDIERDAMQGNPAPDPDPDRRDLVLGALAIFAARLFGTGNPDSDAVASPLALDIESRQSRDDPSFQRANEGAQIGLAAIEIEQDIGDALARPVIGELPATAAFMHRKTRLQEVCHPRGSPRRIKRRMFEEPDEFRCRARRYGFHPRVHEGHGVRVRHEPVRNPPFH